MVEFDNYKLVDKGVCAAKGFKANGIHCGIRKNKDKYPYMQISFALLVLHSPTSDGNSPYSNKRKQLAVRYRR